IAHGATVGPVKTLDLRTRTPGFVQQPRTTAVDTKDAVLADSVGDLIAGLGGKVVRGTTKLGVDPQVDAIRLHKMDLPGRVFHGPFLRVQPFVIAAGVISMTVFLVSAMTRVLRDLRMGASGELQVRDAHEAVVSDKGQGGTNEHT